MKETNTIPEVTLPSTSYQNTRSPEEQQVSRCHVDADMLLPDGKCCGNCVNYRGCQKLIGCSPDSVTCDWAPSRFWEVKN